MTTLEKLIRHHHGAVFDRAPSAVLAMRINADAWEVTGVNLVAERGELVHTYPLANYTLATLGAAMVADGYTVQDLNSEVASLSAMTLLASGGQQDGALNNRLQAYTSLLWVLMHCYAVEVDAARDAVLQALRQMVISTAEADWLDLWGALYSVPRVAGELDADYADRIPVEAFRARCNSFAIEAAIQDATGFDVQITEPWKLIARLDNFRLDDHHRMYSGDSIGYHLIKPVSFENINWPAVLAVINRNRAAGTVVLRPDLYMTAELDVGASLDVEHDSAVGGTVGDTLLLDPPQNWRPADWSEGTWVDGDFEWSGDAVVVDLTPPDPHFANVISLMHLDADFTDSASGTWSGVGSPVISASEKKFGDGSLYLNGSSYLLRSANLDMLTGQFTFEMWVYKGTTSDVGIAFSVIGGGLTLETIGGYIVIGKRNVTPVLATSNQLLPINQWVHIAIELDTPNTRIFQDGVLVASVSNSSFPSGPLQLGAYTSVSKYFTGHIDDFRYTKGVARYTANFTPPTAPFPDS